jgi:GNAT superfamily N-acetyltransferase
MPIAYRHQLPDLQAIRALYAAAPLRRPIGDEARLGAMFEHANVVVSAWDGERLVGLLRGLTDRTYDGYVCDLAVHPGWQRRGIGRGLLEAAARPFPGVQWVLLASPMAKDYYGHLGWEGLGNAWRLARPDPMPDYDAFRAAYADLAERA